MAGRERGGCPPSWEFALRNAGGKEHCGAWHRKPRRPDVSGDRPLEKGKARSPGQRGSAAQNAVALLVHRAGLEQQRNTKGMVSRRKHRPRRCPGFLLGNQAGARTPPPQLQPGGPPSPRGNRLDLTAQEAPEPSPAQLVHPDRARCAQPATGGAGRGGVGGAVSAVIFSSSGPEEGERPRPATQSPPSWTPRRPPGQAPGLSPGRC